MANKKLGVLVKEARTEKKMSQAALAEKVDGLTASDVGKIERGEKIPTQAVIKSMAKALGVTQTSLLNASDVAKASSSSSKTSSSSAKTSSSSGKKTSSSSSSSSAKKTSSSSGKTSSSSSSGKKTSSSSSSSGKKTSSSSSNKKTSSSSSSSSDNNVKVTAAEKRLLTAYRKADSSTKKAVLNILEGNGSISDILTGLISGKMQSGSTLESIGSALSSAFGKTGK